MNLGLMNRGRMTAALATAMISIACSSSTPTAPTPPPPPPVVINTPPTIAEVRTSAPRADADQEIEVTAFVQDTETPLDQLTYTWSALPATGVFAGTGPLVRWRAPRQQKTPDDYTLTLTVTEKYTSAGQPQENKVSSSVTVHYNDSVAEVNALAVQFYKDFGAYDVGAAECVRNFSGNGTCASEKEMELQQIQANRDRRDYRIVGSTLNMTPLITLDSSMTGATFLQSCTFDDVSTVNGKHTLTTGDCYLTAVYENWRWWLCKSNFLDGTSIESKSLQLRVPGRVIKHLP